MISIKCKQCGKNIKAKTKRRQFCGICRNKRKKENKEEYLKRRSARLEKAGGSHTEEEFLELKEKYSFLCFYCGKKPKRLQKDHLIAVAIGGNDNIKNIVPSCKTCNRKKGSKLPEIFFVELLKSKISGKDIIKENFIRYALNFI